TLDEKLWREELQLYHGQGVHGLLVNGTTGEWFSQSDAERRRVAESAGEELSGQTTVVVGCTTDPRAARRGPGGHAKEDPAVGTRWRGSSGSSTGSASSAASSTP